MAVGQINLRIKTTWTYQDMQRFLPETLQREQAAANLLELLMGLGSGEITGVIDAYMEDDDGVAATNTITVANHANVTAGDTITICGVVFTARAAASADPLLGEWTIGANANGDATNLSAAINAHPLLKSLLTAAPSTNTVVMTMSTKGVQGNQGTVATSDGTAFTVTARFASGAVGTTRAAMRTYRLGL